MIIQTIYPILEGNMLNKTVQTTNHVDLFLWCRPSSRAFQNRNQNRNHAVGHILLVETYIILSLKSTRELSSCRPKKICPDDRNLRRLISSALFPIVHAQQLIFFVLHAFLLQPWQLKSLKDDRVWVLSRHIGSYISMFNERWIRTKYLKLSCFYVLWLSLWNVHVVALHGVCMVAS